MHLHPSICPIRLHMPHLHESSEQRGMMPSKCIVAFYSVYMLCRLCPASSCACGISINQSLPTRRCRSACRHTRQADAGEGNTHSKTTCGEYIPCMCGACVRCVCEWTCVRATTACGRCAEECMSNCRIASERDMHNYTTRSTCTNCRPSGHPMCASLD